MEQGTSWPLKQKINRKFPNMDRSCECCGLVPASLTHMFWSCIFHTLSNVLNINVDLDPLTAVFGVIDPNVGKTSSESNMITFVRLLARRLILLNWKQAVAPTHANWMREDGAFRFRENKILITKTGVRSKKYGCL